MAGRIRSGLAQHEMPEANAKNLRVFGVGLGVILSVFAFFAWRRESPSTVYLLGSAGVFALLGFVAPMVLRPIYQVWVKIAGVIAVVNTFLILTIVYYLMITPYAVVFRIFGRDPLDRKWRTGESYWHTRVPRSTESYEKQF